MHVHRLGRGRILEPLGLGGNGRDDHARLDNGHADPESLHLLGERLLAASSACFTAEQ